MNMYAREEELGFCKQCGPTEECLRCGQAFPHSRSECDDAVAQDPGFQRAVRYFNDQLGRLTSSELAERVAFVVHSPAAESAFDAGHAAARIQMSEIINR